jgi:hypothetical protein
MKTRQGSGGTATAHSEPQQYGQDHALVNLLPETSVVYSLNTRLHGPQNWSRRSGEENNACIF